MHTSRAQSCARLVRDVLNSTTTRPRKPNKLTARGAGGDLSSRHTKSGSVLTRRTLLRRRGCEVHPRTYFGSLSSFEASQLTAARAIPVFEACSYRRDLTGWPRSCPSVPQFQGPTGGSGRDVMSNLARPTAEAQAMGTRTIARSGIARLSAEPELLLASRTYQCSRARVLIPISRRWTCGRLIVSPDL